MDADFIFQLGIALPEFVAPVHCSFESVIDVGVLALKVGILDSQSRVLLLNLVKAVLHSG